LTDTNKGMLYFCDALVPQKLLSSLFFPGRELDLVATFAMGMQGEHAESLPDNAILQWRCGKEWKTRLAPIAREAAFFPDHGGPSFSHAAEASGERKEEWCEQPASRIRRARGWRFEVWTGRTTRTSGRARALSPACRQPLACCLVQRRQVQCVVNSLHNCTCSTHTVPYGIPEIKWEVKRILIYECPCNERLKSKAKGSTLLVYTGLWEGLEHLKRGFR
jgi:hypothetical protein